MTGLAFRGGRLVMPGGVVDGLCLRVERGLIRDIVPDDDRAGEWAEVDLDGDYLLPGFVDTQVNGGGGALFNADPSVETIRMIAAAHARLGATTIVPTLISDELDVIEAGLRAVEQARAEDVPGIAGIHIEGPFIAPERRGIHDAAKLRRIDARAIDLLRDFRGGAMIVTLAPELVDVGIIAQLTEMGILVCGGHSNADYDCVRVALAAGLAGFTHIFNAMSPMQHRAPGMVGAALESDAWCGVIVDGLHVDPAVLRIAFRAHRMDRFMLVSDAMPTAGWHGTEFWLGDTSIVARDGKLLGPDGTLAGADLDMSRALRNAIELTGLSVVQASMMASTAPAHFLRLGDRFGTLAPGRPADMVRLTADLRVKQVWQAGQPLGLVQDETSQRVSARPLAGAGLADER